MLKSQPRVISEKHNVFTEDVNKIALSANDDAEQNQLIRQKHMHMERGKTLICKKEDIDCNSIIKQYKIINSDNIKLA